MVFEFWWDAEFFGALRPRCACDGGDEGAGSLFAGLLTDDGGIDAKGTLAWLDVGIERTRAVRLGSAERCDWGRETLFARIGPDQVTLGWCLHEDEAAVVGPADFERVLVAWRDFLLAGPADAGTGRVHIRV